MSSYDTQDYRDGYRDGYQYGRTQNDDLLEVRQGQSLAYREGFADGVLDTVETESEWNDKMESDYHVIGNIFDDANEEN